MRCRAHQPHRGEHEQQTFQTNRTSAISLPLLTSVLWAPAANATSTWRAKGNGSQFSVSWTEYDLDDLLNIPGNVHLGYPSGYDEQYGIFFYGNVTDFECDPGAVPWGGGHGVQEVVAKGQQSADPGPRSGALFRQKPQHMAGVFPGLYDLRVYGHQLNGPT